MKESYDGTTDNGPFRQKCLYMYASPETYLWTSETIIFLLYLFQKSIITTVENILSLFHLWNIPTVCKRVRRIKWLIVYVFDQFSVVWKLVRSGNVCSLKRLFSIYNLYLRGLFFKLLVIELKKSPILNHFTYFVCSSLCNYMYR